MRLALGLAILAAILLAVPVGFAATETTDVVTLDTGTIYAGCNDGGPVEKTLPTTPCTKSVVLTAVSVDDDGYVAVGGNQIWQKNSCTCFSPQTGSCRATGSGCAASQSTYTDVTQHIKRNEPTPVTLYSINKCRSSGARAISATFYITELVPQPGEYCENGEIKKGCKNPDGTFKTCNAPPSACVGTDGKKLRNFTSALNATCGCVTTPREIDCGTSVTRCDPADTKKIIITTTAACSIDAEGNGACPATTTAKTCTMGCILDSARNAICTGSNGGANKQPVLTALSASKTIAAENTQVRITGTASDENGDVLELRCSETEGTKDNFNAVPCDQPKMDKTKPECGITAHGSGTLRLYCRAFDSDEYSDARSVQLTIDNEPPSSIISSPLENTVQSGDFDVYVDDVDTVGGAPAQNNIDKAYFRTTSSGTDTTFLLKGAKLAITGNSRSIVLLGSEPQDITYKFEATGAPPNVQVDIYYSTDSISGPKTTASTEARKILKSCFSNEYYNTIANSKGWRILQFSTDSEGRGSAEIRTCATPAGAGAYLFDAYSGSSKIAANVFKIQISGQTEPFLWAARPVSGSFKVTAAQCPDQSATMPACSVFVKATDKAGNEGQESSRSFRISQVSSKITAPKSGDSFGSKFKTSVEDKEFSGVGFKICEYKVVSNGVTTLDWRERTCNSQQEIPVKTDGCKDAGKDACEILVRATNNNNIASNIESIKVSIDFNKPITTINTKRSDWINQGFDADVTDTDPSGGTLNCEYKVESGKGTSMTVTQPWAKRECSKKVAISVGPSGNCRHEGAGACIVFARSGKGSLQSDEAKESYNILLTTVTDDNGFSSITTTPTTTGLRFSAVPKNTIGLPIFRICNAESSIADCKSAFTQGASNCGIGRPCLCGSAASYSCDVTCSETKLNYYALVTGSGGATIISPVNFLQPDAKPVTCPKTAAGEIEESVLYFELLDGTITRLIGENDVICRTGTDDEKKAFCPRVDALKQAQRLVRDHVQWLNSIKSNPSASNTAEMGRRNEDVRKKAYELMTGGQATNAGLQMTMPETARLDDIVKAPATIIKTGELQLYAKVDCSITRPAGSRLQNMQRMSECLSFTPVPQPILAMPARLNIGDDFTVSVSNGIPNSDALLHCISPGGTDACDGIKICTTNAQGSCFNMYRFEPPEPTGDWTAYATLGGRESNRISFKLYAPPVATGSATAVTARAAAPPPLPGSASYSLEFKADEAGIWNVMCKLLVSFRPDCSNSFEQDRKSGPINVIKTLKSMITGTDFPATAVKSSTVQIKIMARNPDRSDVFAFASCRVQEPASSGTPITATQKSECKLIRGEQEIPLDINFLASKTGKWTADQCKLSISSQNDCRNPEVHDSKPDVKMIDVVEPDKIILTKVQFPAEATADKEATATATVYNPPRLEDTYASVRCTASTPGGAHSLASACAFIEKGNEKNIPIKFTPSARGKWDVTTCTLFSSNDRCVTETSRHVLQNAGSFNVTGGRQLAIDQIAKPGNAKVRDETTTTLRIKNPTSNTRFGKVACTFIKPDNTRESNSSAGCTRIDAGQSQSFAIKMTANTAGTWTLESCRAESGTEPNQCTSSIADDLRTPGETFSVAAEGKLSFGQFEPLQDIQTGQTGQVKAAAINGDDAAFYGKMECTFRNAANQAVNNASSCVSVPANGSAQLTANIFGNAATAWNVESCTLKASRRPDCSSPATHDTKTNIGSIRVAAAATEKDLKILSARPMGNVFRGEFARVEIAANGTAADDKFALATCTFRTPSGLTRTNNSQCAQIQARSQKTLTLQMRADETGTWTVTSCVLGASPNQDCSQAAVNDTRSNVGTFDAAAPSTLIIAQIIPKDTLNGTAEDINVKVDNALADSRFGRVTCNIKKPSGASVSRTSSCARVGAGTARDFVVSDTVNEIGTWNVTSCSVFESTISDCSSGSTVHTANGTTFAVSRADRISFTSGLIFPDSVQNGSVIILQSSARNPSAADIFAKMRCIFVLPQSTQTMPANSSCFVLPGETALPVSVSLPVNKVGLWQIASCSMLGAGDSACSDETAHATNSTGGQFISIGPQVNNLSIIGRSISATVIRGGAAEIRLTLGNDHDFQQYANMTCSLKNPNGQEENITSQCSQISARGTQELNLTKTLNELGIWNVTSCRVAASPSAACAGAILQNTSDSVGTINVTDPTSLIIRSASGRGALNASFTNITAVLENPLGQRKFALVACDLRSPAGRNFTNSTCTGLNAGEMKGVNLSFFVDEPGIWSVQRCSINASNSFDCSNSQSHANITDGTFNVARRTNLTFTGARTTVQRVFNGTPVTAEATVRNPADTDLFGVVTCSFSVGAATRQNSSECTLFRGGQLTTKGVSITGDLLGTWTGNSCIVTGTLNTDCAQPERHDAIGLAGSANVTTVPDLVITGLDVPEGINRNTTGLASVRIRNDGIAVYANATCSIRSPVRTATNSSSCQRIDAGQQTIVVPFFVDRLGNWSVFGCSVSASSNSTCAQSRLHNTSNLTRDFNATGRTLEIVSVLKPEENLKVQDRAEILVTVRNIDNVLHKGFVNCTLRQPNNETREITSPIQTIPVDDTRLFKPNFVAELSGQWRLRSCAVFRTESPAFREDEKIIDEIFLVGSGVKPPPGGFACVVDTDCPGTDARCFCSGQACQACPTGTTCRSNRCESIIPPQCTFDSDCPAGYKCERSACVAGPARACAFDSDCPLGYQCDSGRCNPKPAQCAADSQCLPGYKCVNRQCEKQAAPPEEQYIINLIIIIIVALIVAMMLFVFVRRRIARQDIFSEVEGRK